MQGPIDQTLSHSNEIHSILNGKDQILAFVITGGNYISCNLFHNIYTGKSIEEKNEERKKNRREKKKEKKKNGQKKKKRIGLSFLTLPLRHWRPVLPVVEYVDGRGRGSEDWTWSVPFVVVVSVVSVVALFQNVQSRPVITNARIRLFSSGIVRISLQRGRI